VSRRGTNRRQPRRARGVRCSSRGPRPAWPSFSCLVALSAAVAPGTPRGRRLATLAGALLSKSPPRRPPPRTSSWRSTRRAAHSIWAAASCLRLRVGVGVTHKVVRGRWARPGAAFAVAGSRSVRGRGRRHCTGGLRGGGTLVLRDDNGAIDALSWGPRQRLRGGGFGGGPTGGVSLERRPGSPTGN
jgi:hypothetical protein